MFHYTYVIHRVSTGEYYIGVRSCKSLPQSDPYMGSSVHLAARLKTEDDWFKYIIAEYPTREEAFADEPRLIEGHRGNGLCLNRSAGGNGWRTFSHTVEARRKISAASKRQVRTAEWTANVAAAQRGTVRPKSSETLNRPDVKAKMSASLKSRMATPETKARKSEASRKQHLNPELEAQRAAAIKAAKSTPEARARQSAISKAMWERRRANGH